MNDNSIMSIYPYLHKGTWVFDDEDKKLAREPFVVGIDVMLSHVVAMKGLDKNGFCLQFSSSFLPDAHMTLDWLRAEGGGNWYHCEQLDIEGWLCPALYKYFKEAPKKIWTIFSNKIVCD